MATKKTQGTHEAYSPKHEAHNLVTSSDGGSCLAAHEPYYVEKNSCSYRWQALLKVRENRVPYDRHSNPRYRVDQQMAGSLPAAKVPKGAATIRSWNQATKKGTVLWHEMMLPNFATNRIPYPNQAHHVLNKASLHKGIDALAEIHNPIRTIIVDGLLAEKYNINHKDNMLILPTQDKACKETGFPNHNSGGHKSYNDEILTSVKEALTPYETLAKEAKQKAEKKEHGKIEPLKLKENIERISNLMYKSMLAQADINHSVHAPAMSMEHMSPNVYDCIK